MNNRIYLYKVAGLMKVADTNQLNVQNQTQHKVNNEPQGGNTWDIYPNKTEPAQHSGLDAVKKIVKPSLNTANKIVKPYVNKLKTVFGVSGTTDRNKTPGNTMQNDMGIQNNISTYENYFQQQKDKIHKLSDEELKKENDIYNEYYREKTGLPLLGTDIDTSAKRAVLEHAKKLGLKMTPEAAQTMVSQTTANPFLARDLRARGAIVDNKSNENIEQSPFAQEITRREAIDNLQEKIEKANEDLIYKIQNPELGDTSAMTIDTQFVPTKQDDIQQRNMAYVSDIIQNIRATGSGSVIPQKNDDGQEIYHITPGDNKLSFLFNPQNNSIVIEKNERNKKMFDNLMNKETDFYTNNKADHITREKALQMLLYAYNKNKGMAQNIGGYRPEYIEELKTALEQRGLNPDWFFGDKQDNIDLEATNNLIRFAQEWVDAYDKKINPQIVVSKTKQPEIRGTHI